MYNLNSKLMVLSLLFTSIASNAQTNPAILNWLQNTTNITGRHYVKGNSTAITDATLANVQNVKYSADWVYISTQGIPAYVTGPFLDNNPSLASAQNAIFKISLKPVKNPEHLQPPPVEILVFLLMAWPCLITATGFRGKTVQVL
jgi:hypothetical protein